MQQISDLHSKFALRPHYIWKYGRHPICDRCRLGKKKEETTGRKYNGLPYSVGRPQIVYDHLIEVAPSLQMVHTLALRHS